MSNRFLKILISLLILAAAFTLYPAPVNAAVTTQLGVVLDGSGSITAPDWSIIVNGVADAVVNNMPHDGTVELTVVQFSPYKEEIKPGCTGFPNPICWAATEVQPTVITAGNFATVADSIRAITQGGGSTPMADGVYVAWLDIAASPNFATAARQVINLATDGQPNEAWACWTCSGHTGNALTDVTAARNYAVALGLDELDAEAIGTGPSVTYLRDSVVWPQPGNIAPPFNAGWVQQVADAAAFAAAMGNKFQVVLSTTSTTPSATTTTTTVSSTVSTTVIESTTTVSSTMSTVSTIATSTATSYSTSTTTSGDTVTEHVTEFDTVYAYLLVLVYSAIAEYPIGLPLLVILMIVVYGLIRRKTLNKNL